MDRITIGRKVIRFTVKGTAIVMNGRKRRRLPIGEVYPLSILLVSQKINVEAGAMVLGNNRFTFETDLALTEFKAAARSKFAFLRDIVVEDMISEHKDLLRELIPLKDPTRIAIDRLLSPVLPRCLEELRNDLGRGQAIRDDMRRVAD